MTLIVACRVDDSILIVSDTHITKVNHEKLDALEGSVLKTVMLTPQCALSFSGNEIVAGKTILSCIKEWRFLEPDQIVKNVLDAHIESNKKPETPTDYLLAFLNPTRLVCIKDGKQSETDTAWIGNEPGYSVFSQAYIGKHPSKKEFPHKNHNEHGDFSASMHIDSHVAGTPIEMPRKLRHAMQAVIDDAAIPGVGGFPILLTSSPQGFHFSEYVHLQTSAMELEAFVDLKEIPTGDAPGGSYTMYCATACQYGLYVPLLYIPEALTGVIFWMSESGIYRSNKIDSLSFQEFLWAVRDTGMKAVSRLACDEELSSMSLGFVDGIVVDGRVIPRQPVPEEKTEVIQIHRKPILRTRNETVSLLICESHSEGPWFDRQMARCIASRKSPKFIQEGTRHSLSLMAVFRRYAIQQKRVWDLRPGQSTEVCAYLLFDSTKMGDRYGIEFPKGVVNLSRLVITGVVTAE